jgi:hypothetical protein
MWCDSCQRASSKAETADATRCARCGKELVGQTTRSQDITRLTLPEEDWKLEADIRSVHRLVDNLRGKRRIDPPSSLAEPHRERAPILKAERTSEHAAVPKSNLAAWAILSVGLATFACGAVLLGWAYAAGREDLWPIGMPLTLIGQAGLILGLVLQLDGLWQSSHQTQQTLVTLDDELTRVRQATTLLSTSHSGPAQSFYAHMAEGATPQLLLADLKGQLDLLAQQMDKK